MDESQSVTHTFVAYALENLAQKEGLAAPNWEPSSAMGRSDVISRISTGNSGVFVFRFGVVVFWNLPQLEGRTLVDQVATTVGTTMIMPESGDEFRVIENPNDKPRVEWGRLVLDRISPQRTEVVARLLAQSVALDRFERQADAISNRLGQITRDLVRLRKLPISPSFLQNFIFETIVFRNSLVGKLELLDRPETIWDDRLMDTLFSELRGMFDLPERFQSLDYKLRLVQESLELIVDTVRDQRLYWLELAIVIMFAVEIVLAFVPGH